MTFIEPFAQIGWEKKVKGNRRLFYTWLWYMLPSTDWTKIISFIIYIYYIRAKYDQSIVDSLHATRYGQGGECERI